MGERDQKFNLPTLFCWFLIVPARSLIMGRNQTKAHKKPYLELQNKNGKHTGNPEKNICAINVKEENVMLRQGFSALLFETIGV